MKPFHRYTTFVIVILAVTVSIILISGTKQSNEQITIGVSAPLTGATSWFGDFIKQGIDLAWEELSEEDRRLVKLVWEDDKCSAQNGISAIQKLIQVDRVKYIIGPLCNQVSIPTEKMFEDNKVISITTGLPNNQIANMGAYHFSFLPEIEFLMKELATYVINQTSYRSLGIIFLNDEYGRENQRHFKKYFEQMGGRVVSEEPFAITDPDVKSQLVKIKEKKPEAILLVAYGPKLIAILKQMNELGMKSLPKFGINSFESQGVLTEAAELAEGVIYPVPADRSVPRSAKEYAEKYAEKFGTDNDVYSANAYDSFNVLFKTINECGYEEVDCVQQKFSSLKNYPGANGTLSVDGRGVGAYKGALIKTVKNGRFVPLEAN